MQPKIGTSEAALQWLSSLETPCKDCTAKDGVPCFCLACHGTGMVPVLPSLRETCTKVHRRLDLHVTAPSVSTGYADCWEVKCPGWQPRRDRDVLHEAMHKNGWDVHLHFHWYSEDSNRFVGFRKQPYSPYIRGEDADDYIAAAKAMRNAGYGGGDALQKLSP